jgi:enamine deaminase RidA (YjgF/YER057c/UK114 family)
MIERKLSELGLELPEAAKPSFLYVPVIVHGHIAYVSGQLPKVGDDVRVTGKVGAEVSIEEAKEAARICVLQSLAVLREALGSLDRVERILKVNGYVASAPGFNQQPAVLDAASELLVRVFGQAGQHARAAVGVAELPRNSPVEIEFTVAVRPS